MAVEDDSGVGDEVEKGNYGAKLVDEEGVRLQLPKLFRPNRDLDKQVQLAKNGADDRELA